MTDIRIDCQVHCAAPEIADLLPYMKKGWADRFVRAAFLLPPGDDHPGGRTVTTPSTPESVSATLAGDVTAAILLPHQVMPTANWTDTKLCAIYASAINSYMIDHWLPADPRFRLAIAVSPHDPELAAAEIERLRRNERVVAVTMPLLAAHLGSPFYRPIIEAVARNELTLIVHPGGKEGTITGTPSLGGIGPRFAGEHDCLIWQVAAVTIGSLIYDGIFVEFPELRVAFADFGFEWLGPVVWRLDAEWRALRIDVPWVTEAPSTYLARHVRIVVGARGGVPDAALAQIVQMAPETSLIFGSNHPFEREDDWLDTLPDALRQRIAWRNAAETFGPRLAA